MSALNYIIDAFLCSVGLNMCIWKASMLSYCWKDMRQDMWEIGDRVEIARYNAVNQNTQRARNEYNMHIAAFRRNCAERKWLDLARVMIFVLGFQLLGVGPIVSLEEQLKALTGIAIIDLMTTILAFGCYPRGVDYLLHNEPRRLFQVMEGIIFPFWAVLNFVAFICLEIYLHI